ncbi:SDR family oxidoreductase [Amycolatopsis acidicola]|uniref:SDR family oxidoreductase n=1 Tax=Amycolatopsis acidicola TaxID=2596893 RepID=A0A5N0UNF7_9PSEU|nr:SDR family oxidoreductase [Amycolatopsis acidicola]KAA9148872.1 SDR family oxidoreductase [Amycolatopsis acidicola]
MTDGRFAGHRLDGRVALVTGGSRGLGREMVLAFAEAGADVVVASRKLDRCEEVAAEVREATGRRALAVSCHMGDWAAQDTLVERVYEEFGRCDVLVNNAGMSPLYDSLETISEELYDKVMAVNLKGPFRLTTLVASRMARGDGGSVINISSTASAKPSVAELPYGAAKAGLNLLTLGFAQAYGPKVRVNAIMCGPFLTDISKAWDMKAAEEKFRRYPLGRAGRPEEIVGTALYLAGEMSSYTTGTVVPVDGGQALSR